MKQAVPAESTRNRSICFIAHNAYGSLAGHNEQHAGGIERQQVTMAVWLAEHGWDVSMVTWREADDIAIGIRGVSVIPMCRRGDGLPIVRFLHPRWTSLNAALRRANTDLYYYNCGDLGLGQIAIWAKRRRRPVVFSVPSDPDCEADLPALGSVRERALYRHGLKHCDDIIVQSSKQRDLLRKNFGRDATVLPMPCRGFRHATKPSSKMPGHRLRVLWVGRISAEKRPDWMLDVAERLPDLDFMLVGAPNRASEFAATVQRRAVSLPNVSMPGRVPYEQMAAYYAKADVLCCTSLYEGFPNVFLEAWSAGLSVYTTCDPDYIVATNKLGAAVDSIDGLVSELQQLANDPGKQRSQADSAIRYFEQHHDIDTAMAEFERHFMGVIGRYRGESNG